MVRKERDNIRITAQLIDAKTDRHLWSETYDRKLTSIFAIQDEISGSIVDALRETLGVDIQKTTSAVAVTTDMNAYEAFLKARELFSSRNPLALRQSLEIYQQAIERDPGFARAYEGLASIYAVLPGYSAPEGYEALSYEESYRLTTLSARKALELDPTLSMPHAVLGIIFSRANDYETALRELDTAIEMDPRESTAWMWRGMRLSILGYLEEALKYYEEAYRLDPHTGINSDHFGWTLLYLGRNEESYPYVGKALDKGRTIAGLQFLHNVTNGDFNSARMAAMHMFRGYEMLQYFIPIFESRPGTSERQQLVDRFFASLDPSKPRQMRITVDPIFLGAMGVFDQATKFFVEGPGWRTHVWNPALAEYRASEQFKDYVRQIQMDRYWRKNGWPDLCRPLGDDDFECD